MKKYPIIIDCDPGKDDAFAILYALAHEKLDVKLITTVSGNVSVDQTTHNALGLTKLANSDVPVLRGSKMPLIKEPVFAAEIHGKSGLGGFSFKDDEINKETSGNYLDEMYQLIDENINELTLVAIGPLTNIAKLIFKYPDVVDKIKGISLMGGSLKGGNTTVSAEFNFYVDPEAAKVVFESGIPIIMAGLDVTEKAVIFHDDTLKLKEINKVGKVLHDIVMLSDYRREDGAISQLNDVIAIMAITEPEIFNTKDTYVTIDIGKDIAYGMSIADQRVSNGNPNKIHKVILDLDHSKFLELIYERIAIYG